MSATQIAAFAILGGFLLFCLAYAWWEYRHAMWVDPGPNELDVAELAADISDRHESQRTHIADEALAAIQARVAELRGEA